MIKAVIFDYFGVISSINVWKNLKQKQYELYLNLSDKVNLGEIHWQQFVDEIVSRSGMSADELESLYKQEKIDQNIISLIKELKDKGYKTALLTNANHEYVGPIYDQLGFGHIFDEIIISSRIGLIKPDPEIYLYCLDKLGVEAKETIFIDDTNSNVSVAQNIGIEAILYKDYSQLLDELNKLL